ncbi:MAG: hypothetical protein NVS9B14_06690 [Candidatus Acidiferrum sp.]
MPLTIAQLAPIRSRDPYLYEALLKIVQEINNIGTRTGSSGTPLSAPPRIASVTVNAGGGDVSLTINDPAGQAQPNLGLHYFIEYDTNPAFPNPTVLDNGPSRGAFLHLPGLTLYFRVTSAFRNSANSPYVTWGGTTPAAVATGGTSTVNPPGGGSGSGGGGGGFGGTSKNGAFSS